MDLSPKKINKQPVNSWKMLNTISYLENTIQNHDEILLHSH